MPCPGRCPNGSRCNKIEGICTKSTKKSPNTSPKKPSKSPAKVSYPSETSTFTSQRVKGKGFGSGTMLSSGFFIPRSLEDADKVEKSMYRRFKLSDDEQKVFVDSLMKGKIVEMGYIIGERLGEIQLYGDRGDYKIDSSIPIRLRILLVDA